MKIHNAVRGTFLVKDEPVQYGRQYIEITEPGPPRPREVAGKGRKRARQHRKAYGPYSRIDTVHEAQMMAQEIRRILEAEDKAFLALIEKEEE